MTLQVGRIGIGGVTLQSARDWGQQGDKVRLSGEFPVPAVEDALWLREQILGYDDNPDEGVVPVLWTPDSRAAGYYRVLGTDVSMVGPSLANGLFGFHLDLERVAGYSAPLLESVVVGGLLANTHGIATALPWHAVPAACLEYFYTAPGGTGVYKTRSSSDGDVVHFSKPSVYSANAVFSLAPVSFYIGAATLEVDGPTYRVVVGRQVRNTPTTWRLSNGMVRVTPGTAAGTIDVAHWDGAAWRTAKNYSFALAGVAQPVFINSFDELTVLRNAPEEVVIRLSCRTLSGFVYGPVYIDLALRRGDRVVKGYISAYTSGEYGVLRGTAEAATAITGAIRATADDANGDRYVLASAKNYTADLVNGGISLIGGNAATTFDFGIGLQLSGSSTTDLADSLASQYYSAQSEKMTIRAR